MTRIVIDASFLGYQAFHALGGLMADGMETGVLFNFLSRILSIGRLYQTNEFIFAFDSPNIKSVRLETLPTYKGNRREDLSEEEKQAFEALYEQLRLLREGILPSLGFTNILRFEGFEADDIIASVVGVDLVEDPKNNRAARALAGCGCRLPKGCAPEDHFVIVSADHDLYQLLGKTARVLMFNPTTKEEYTRQRFCLEYEGVGPEMWSRIRAIAGCDTDNIPGVRGVAEKTAIKYLLGTLPTHTQAYKNIEASQAQTERNFSIVDLPHRLFREVLITITPPSFTGKGGAFKEMCAKYMFQTFLKEPTLSEWKCFFQGDFGRTSQVRDGRPLGRVDLRRPATKGNVTPTKRVLRDDASVGFGF